MEAEGVTGIMGMVVGSMAEGEGTIELSSNEGPSSSVESSIYGLLYDAFPNAEEVLEELRRNLGKRGYAVLHEIVDLTKRGIELVYRGDEAEVAICDNEILDRWEGFLDGRLSDRMASFLSSDFDHDLPGFSREQFIHQISQEIVEFKVVAAVWPVIAGEIGQVLSLPSPKKCLAPIQAWFKGILDATSECGKMLNRKLENPDLTLEERIEWYRRYILVARQLVQRMRDISHSPGGIINNSTQRGEGFHRALGGISRMLGAITVTYIDLLSKKAANDDLIERLGKPR